MKAKSGPGAWTIYAAVRAALAVLQVFPIDWNLRAAKVMARLWVLLTRRHRDRALLHLRESYGDTLPPERLAAIADASLAHWTTFLMELACAPRLLTPTSWPKYITPVGFDEVLDILVSGQGVILVTGHYGHFEMGGYLLACLGFDVVAVMRPLDNVYLNRFVVESRAAHGLELLDKKGAMQHARGVLEAGRPLAFIADQDAGRKGVFVDFFGRPASTYKSIGLLAMTTGCPVVVGYARRVGDEFRYEVGVQRVIRPHEWEAAEEPLKFITQAYTSAIEATVRTQPEQYLWMHRRWKSKPKVRTADRADEAE